jgi:hypothetical protein
MPKGDAVAAAIAARVRASDETIVLAFPSARAALPTGPAALPASPMTGAAPAITLAGTAPAPEWPPRTVQCLWLDAPLSETPDPWVRDARVGWVDGAQALARVLWADVAIDADDPAEGTWVDRAQDVQHRGTAWRVIRIERMGPSFRAPHSVSVWLKGANLEGQRLG